MAQKIQVEVAKKEQVTEKVYLVTFRLVEPQTIEFRAGQNMMLMVAPGINRTMSIASPPRQKSEILMVHDISPMGQGSKWTLGLKVGDSATVVAPTGGALSFIDSPRKKVMVATGTGVAPFHSMILDKLSVVSHQSSDSLKADGRQLMTLYWGLRYETDIYWKEEFEKLVPFYLVLSKPTENWRGLRGHVTEHVIANEFNTPERRPNGLLSGVESEFYLCGNKPMIEEARTKLLERNVPKEQIKTELFY